MKIRETTRGDTFTIPHSEDEKMEFFHGKVGSDDQPWPWEELHIVCKVTKLLLARYSRNQAFQLTSRSAKRGKSRSGVVVNILPI